MDNVVMYSNEFSVFGIPAPTEKAYDYYLSLNNSSTFNYTYNNSPNPPLPLVSFQGTWAGLLGSNLPDTTWQPDWRERSDNRVFVPFPMGTSSCQLTGVIKQPVTGSGGT
jgi:hypothetical protein